mmetsp:Transcript_100784/g.260428  ORF Transcript_100784/g.260428 Transcript_100784/m.260428 type:complete len:212 (-) Transcript_100784:554-1189(-)
MPQMPHPRPDAPQDLARGAHDGPQVVPKPTVLHAQYDARRCLYGRVGRVGGLAEPRDLSRLLLQLAGDLALICRQRRQHRPLPGQRLELPVLQPGALEGERGRGVDEVVRLRRGLVWPQVLRRDERHLAHLRLRADADIGRVGCATCDGHAASLSAREVSGRGCRGLGRLGHGASLRVLARDLSRGGLQVGGRVGGGALNLRLHHLHLVQK